MRKIREILRLAMHCGFTLRSVAKSVGVSRPAVTGYIRQAQASKLTYPDLEKLNDLELDRLFQCGGAETAKAERPQPNWAEIHGELKKKGVTLTLLWSEYKACHSDGYQFTRFSGLYRQWRRTLDLTLRQTHKAGEKLFVDYAGHTIPVTDRGTSKTREAQIFVAVLGASNYTYAEASWDQSLPSWIGAHIHAFEYFHGAPKVVIPDNLRSGVSKACRYEPDLNPTYLDMAVHYNTAILPARVRKPRDKAKVEAGVLIVERWILAALRNRTFFGLKELNDAIGELLEKLNNRPFKKLEGTRKSWFETMERSELLPLPTERYVFSEWERPRVNIDYHVEVKKHYYSVPHHFVHKKMDARVTATTVEIFDKGNRRVASHIRDYRIGQHTTQKEHMPESHRQYLEWTPSRIIRWAGKTGPATAQVVETIISTRAYPEQGYRASLGILRLSKRYTPERLEAACRRAIKIGALRYKSICSILEKGLDREELNERKAVPSLVHTNLRGGNYYGLEKKDGEIKEVGLDTDRPEKRPQNENGRPLFSAES